MPSLHIYVTGFMPVYDRKCSLIYLMAKVSFGLLKLVYHVGEKNESVTREITKGNINNALLISTSTELDTKFLKRVSVKSFRVQPAFIHCILIHVLPQSGSYIYYLSSAKRYSCTTELKPSTFFRWNSCRCTGGHSKLAGADIHLASIG